MNILFISRGYPSEKYPTNGIFEYDQAKALANYGHKVIFCFVDIRSLRRIRKWGIEKFERDNILIYGINIPLGIIPRNISSYFRYHGLKIMYRKIKKEYGKPKLMHAHFTNYAYAAARLKKINKIPLVITEHSSEIMKNKIDKKVFKMAKFAYSQADKLISVSPAFKEIIENKFNEESIYVPNIVDTDIFKYCSKKNKYDEFNFISVGNLIKHKRMHHTIKAFNKAFKNNSKVKLKIIGDGPEKKTLESLIKKLNLEDRISLTGKLKRKQIAEYFKNSDAFILASKGETFGVVFIEAMASGLPVIATRCGGPEHFIKQSQGIIIEKDNINKLVTAMQDIYNKIDRYDNEKISKMTIKQFSPENVAEQITQVYNDVLN